MYIGSNIQFILSILTEKKTNEQPEEMKLRIKDRQKAVRVTGTIEREMPGNHHAHPYTLTIEKFELIE